MLLGVLIQEREAAMLFLRNPTYRIQEFFKNSLAM